MPIADPLVDHSDEPDSVVQASETAAVAWVLGGPLRGGTVKVSLVCWAIIGAVIALPARGLYLGTGASMEEGFMLVFPKEMLDGKVPNVDFLHLYGPGALHVLMGWYRVFGYTLESQRSFGLLQHVALIFGVYALCRAWGHRLATISAVTVTLLVLTPIGLSALAWEGAVALGLWSVVFGIRAIHTSDSVSGSRDRTLALAAAGALAGLSLAFRPDLVVALALAHACVWWSVRSVRAFAAGAVVGLIPVWIHLAVAGIGPSWRGMVADPVKYLRPGRELPRPPSFSHVDGALQAVAEGPLDAPWWRFPALAAHHQLFVWFFVVIVTAIATAGIAVALIRRAGATPTRITLLIGSLFGLGMLGQALQRPDSTHLAWGSCVSFALVPAVARELFELRSAPLTEVSTRQSTGRSTGRHDLVAAVLVVATFFVVCPFYTFRTYLLFSRISVGQKPGGYEVSRDDRRFYFGNEPLQHASQAAIDDLDAMSSPGERLLVGPADLSRTIYSDVVFYFMFPDLEPATYFIEMDPGLADREGSSLAGDVASADWLLLTNFWTGWYEPNASSEFGSQAPNHVVADRFCLVGNYEDALVLLYRACAQGDGVSPAGIGIGAERRASLERELAERAAATTTGAAEISRVAAAATPVRAGAGAR